MARLVDPDYGTIKQSQVLTNRLIKRILQPPLERILSFWIKWIKTDLWSRLDNSQVTLNTIDFIYLHCLLEYLAYFWNLKIKHSSSAHLAKLVLVNLAPNITDIPYPTIADFLSGNDFPIKEPPGDPGELDSSNNYSQLLPTEVIVLSLKVPSENNSIHSIPFQTNENFQAWLGMTWQDEEGRLWTYGWLQTCF